MRGGSKDAMGLRGEENLNYLRLFQPSKSNLWLSSFKGFRGVSLETIDIISFRICYMSCLVLLSG